MTQLSYSNIFEAITEDPKEAFELKFRADVMLVLRRIFEKKGWSQAQIGEALGIPQPRVSELVRGKVELISSDKLIGYLGKVGYTIHPVYKPTRGNKPPIKCEVQEVYAEAA